MRHMNTIKSLLVGLALVGLGACGGEEGTTPEKPPVQRELPQPVLQMIAPNAVAAGDVVTVFGSGFADKAVGQTRLVFRGVFQSTAGNIEQVELEITPTFKNQGTLEWTFGPNIPFSKNDETGTFRGVVQATNVGIDGQQKAATPLSTQVQVRPSILLRQFRPVDAGCQADLTDTTANTKMLIEAKVVGLKAGNSVAPLRFVYTFLKQHFQFEGYVGGQLGLDPEGLFPQTGPVSIVSDVHDGTSSVLGSGVPSTTYVHLGVPSSGHIPTGIDNMFKLAHFKTAPIPNEQANSFAAAITITAIDSTGQSIKRTVPLKVWAPVEVDYDGASRVVEIFEPVPVSSCLYGTDVGANVTYAESVSETRSRSFKLKSEVGGAIDIAVARLNASFGMEVEGQVSSAESTSLQISGFIVPKQYAVFYRQTTQLERTAKLRGHGACGGTTDLGEAIVTDWTWAAELAKGPTCNPLPESNLPKGQKLTD